ncbi:MAG: helix-turn-helix domain-containing protein [Oscillospiraceae bacterium]
MESTLGKRISENRKSLGFTQEELAEKLGVSAQAVSKWENDASCPDILLLPEISKLFGITVDSLLSGKEEPEIKYVPEEERKDINDMMLKIIVDTHDGDKVRVNLPMGLVKVFVDSGADISEFTGSDAVKNIDLNKVMELVEKGAMGNIVEVSTHDGDIVNIFVE